MTRCEYSSVSMTHAVRGTQALEGNLENGAFKEHSMQVAAPGSCQVSRVHADKPITCSLHVPASIPNWGAGVEAYGSTCLNARHTASAR